MGEGISKIRCATQKKKFSIQHPPSAWLYCTCQEHILKSNMFIYRLTYIMGSMETVEIWGLKKMSPSPLPFMMSKKKFTIIFFFSENILVHVDKTCSLQNMQKMLLKNARPVLVSDSTGTIKVMVLMHLHIDTIYISCPQCIHISRKLLNNTSDGFNNSQETTKWGDVAYTHSLMYI